MFFASDNWSGAHPRISEALSNAATGNVPAYGASDLDETVRRKFCEIFECDVTVFFVSTGTAANALAFSAYNKPGAVGFCHRESHIREDECGAPEFFAPGGRLSIVDGPNGKMTPSNLENAIDGVIDFGVSGGSPSFVSLTQATEAGTIHTIDEIASLSDVARFHQLPMHMDGARFANALSSLDCTPAEMTWKNGINVLSFGGTKNGCWCAEALVFFNPEHAAEMHYIQKRSAQVFSKSRFIAAQFGAYLDDDFWLNLAGQANSAAEELEAHVRASIQIRMAWPRQVNEVFAVLKREKAEYLRENGAFFHDWPAPHGMKKLCGPDEHLIRLVTSYGTNSQEIQMFADLLD